MLAQTVQDTPRFIVTLDAPRAAEERLVRVPVAITGRWMRGPAPSGTGRAASEFSITLRDLEEIQRNFAERLNGEINVDYDHASEMPEVAAGGPIPSAGRIVRLDAPEEIRNSGLGTRDSGAETRTPTRRPEPLGGGPNREPRFILWGWYEPTERARELIRNREYRYISPAIDWGSRSKHTGKPQGTTLTSVALTNRPFLEEMPRIRLSDPAYELIEEAPPSRAPKEETRNSKIENRSAEGEFPVSNFDFRVSNTGGLMKQVTLSVVDGKIKIAHEDLKEESFAEPGELRRCLDELGLLAESQITPALRMLAERPGATLSDCVAEIGRRLAARQEIGLNEARALLSEPAARGKIISAAEFFRAEVDRELDEAVRSGRLLPRQRDDWRKMALADLPTFRKILAEQRPQVPLRPVGFAGAPPEDVQSQVRLLVEQRMRERHMTFGQALAEIGREQPELAQQYRKSVTAEAS